MGDPKKSPSIPSWQQASKSDDQSSPIAQHHTSDPTTQSSHAELLEKAKAFLQDESIRNAPRERKIVFLQTKGLQASDIEELLREDPPASLEEQHDTEELKTVHDSNQWSVKGEEVAQAKDERGASAVSSPSTKTTPSQQEPLPQPQQPPSPSLSPSPSPSRQRDDPPPPIITYPEFLLKPQKPPPLITIPRLVNAAYAFTGVAALTYGASKYLIEPMLESLTEARHVLADTTLADLEKLNEKLESSVSHVPYIASAAARNASRARRIGEDDDRDTESDDESLTSDPTELFHRDIATQTTPSLSRTPSEIRIDSTGAGTNTTHLDATTHQVTRLTALQSTLMSLLESLDPKEVPYLPPHPTKKLHETLSDFQNVLDRLETTYNPLQADYYYSSGGASSIYAQPADAKGRSGNSNNTTDIVAKVRTEIRNLKGAFLSSRNFPTAPRPATMAKVNSHTGSR